MNLAAHAQQAQPVSWMLAFHSSPEALLEDTPLWNCSCAQKTKKIVPLVDEAVP